VHPTLYFLRSSEQKILTDMLHYAYRLDELNSTLEKQEALRIYNDFYGFTRKDLGLYALVNNEIAGAVWSRKMQDDHHSRAFVDEDSPVISIAVLPKFRRLGIASAMLTQFLQEASVLYPQVSVNVLDDSHAKSMFKKFGFEVLSKQKSYVDEKPSCVMVKKLEGVELVRPSDGYDPSKWLD
jgi:ribosomal-protein-alanine N-acetyltransferase